MTWIQGYNPENRISQVERVAGTCAVPGTTAESWTFTYDGDGVRVMEVYAVAGVDQNTKHYFAGGSYEVEVDHTNADAVSTKKYYSIAGMRVAMDDGTDLVYFASDHLSSTTIVMSNTGTLLSEQRYLPFGEVRADIGTLITETDFGYTGQRNLSGMGLMDYNARFYSPLLGRFVQPDTIIPNPGDSQAWNRYSYAYNNPCKYVDPSGHVIVESEVAGGGGGGGITCDVYPENPYCPKEGEVNNDNKKGCPPGPTGGDPTTPFEVGKEWLTGEVPRNHQFREGDPFTEMLKQDENIQEGRIKIPLLVMSGDKPVGSTGRWDMDISKWDGPYEWGKDIFKRNWAAVYLGSYRLDFTILDADFEAGTVDVMFSIPNNSNVASLLHPSGYGYIDGWTEKVDPWINSHFSTGPMSEVSQFICWIETLDLNPPE